METKLVNGKANIPQTNLYVDFKTFYDDQNEHKKAFIRVSLQNLFNISENAVFRRIKNSLFDTADLYAMNVHLGIAYCSKRGFFFDTNVSKNETLNNYGLS